MVSGRRGNRNFKRPFSSNKKVAKPSPGGKQQSPPSEMREFILRGGLTGSFCSAGASLLLHGGVCGRALGKGDLSAPGTEPESGGEIRLSERIRRRGPGLLVGHGWASPGGSTS